MRLFPLCSPMLLFKQTLLVWRCLQSGSILQGGAISLPKHSTSGLSCARVLAAHTFLLAFKSIVGRVVAMCHIIGVSLWVS